MLKLQTLSVIFVLIIVPITILLSYYIDNQIDTVALQNSYDAKLLNATYDAIVAFEVNTKNNTYSTNAESIRRDINASINTFTKSLANNFGVSGTSKNNMLTYIPALVYTLYDGYYIYAPIPKTTIDENGNPVVTYEHTLKPYIYYTSRYTKGDNTDFIVNYSLDNYIVVYGNINGKYYSEAGYLIYADKYKDYKFQNSDETYYNDKALDFFKGNEHFSNNKSYYENATEYYKNAENFTERFNNVIKNLGNLETVINGETIRVDAKDIFVVSEDNDPDDKLSPFVEHKSTIIKASIESNLKSAIASYNARSILNDTTYDFKMPILDEVEWDKMLSNVSIISFMQGLPVGMNTYNNYMIVTSTENKQCIDEEAIYFVTTDYAGNEGKYYHRINCPLLNEEIKNEPGRIIKGYKSIEFDGIYEVKENSLGEKEGKYNYNGHTALACYECIVESRVGSFQYDEDNLITFKDKDGNELSDTDLTKFRKAYYNALFKERNKLSKVSSYVNDANGNAKF